MSPGNERGRPGQDGPNTSLAGKADFMIDAVTDIGALARRTGFALLVEAERADHVVTRQIVLTLGAAEKKVARTLDRGLSARIVLVKVTPAIGWPPEQVDLLAEEAS